MTTSAHTVCLPATDTGLVPDGWRVLSDVPDTEIDFSELDFSYCPARRSDGREIDGHMLLSLARVVNAIGSLGFAKVVLDEQEAGRRVIPDELRGKKYVVLTRTVLRDREDYRRIACLRCVSQLWDLYFSFLDHGFGSDARLPRRRK